MKTVCQIVQNYYDIDPRVRRKVEALVQGGYEVDVIALIMPSRSQRTYTLNGAQVFAMPSIKYPSVNFVSIWMAFLKVCTLMSDRRYAVIDVNNMPDFLVFSTLFPKMTDAKIILDLHDVMPKVYMTKFGVGKGIY